MKESIILICVWAMLFASIVIGQLRPEQQSGLIVNIRPDFATLDSDGPLVISIHLNNGSQKKFGTEKLPIVIIEKVGDDKTEPEWTVQAYVRLNPKSSYAKKDYLKPGEAATVSVDLGALEWNDPKLSIRGNSPLKGILSPGRYRLSVRMDRVVRGENGQKKIEHATSNEINLRYR